MISNPILPGFHPDPSIVRDGEDYWIATSTFEWLPGIRLHHSRDLVHWRPAGHALTRPSQIDLRGVAPSKGVWAPNLSVHAGVWYLCYSLVRNITDNYFDVDNFLVTAPAAQGPWSDPVYLNSSGFDPALFHDQDGRQWLVNLEWDYRPGHEHPGAIVLQEFSAVEMRLVGRPTPIYRGGSDLGCVEGPLLFRRGDFYYLMAAEGGTGYGHGVTLARSQALQGPWEADPANPIVTSAAARFQGRGNPEYLKLDKFNPDSDLQKSGHGSIVETPGGEVYLAHLCARPALPHLRCVLGRETALQKMVWTDGWLRLAAGGNLARVRVAKPDLPASPWPREPERDDFEGPLSPHWASPRCLVDDTWVSLTRPGWIGLRGRESLFSPFQPSVLARRIQHLEFTAATRLVFDPRWFQESAGLVCLYDTMNFASLRVGWSDELQTRVIELMRADNGRREEFPGHTVALPSSAPGTEPPAVRLRVEARGLELRFSWALDHTEWKPLGPAFDETTLSDEYCKTGEFTGAFVGIAAQDLSRRQAWAWFDWFDYNGEPDSSQRAAEVNTNP